MRLDRINLKIKKNELLEIAVLKNREYITSETLAETLSWAENLEEGLELVFDDIETQIALEKI